MAQKQLDVRVDGSRIGVNVNADTLHLTHIDASGISINSSFPEITDLFLSPSDSVVIFKDSEMIIKAQSYDVSEIGETRVELDLGTYSIFIDLDRTPIVEHTVVQQDTDEVSFTMYAYYDAVSLLSSSDFEQVSKILKAYHININEDSPITNLLRTELRSRFAAGKFSLDDEQTSQSPFSFLGGLDVTRYVDGLARFLVARTKKELSMAYFKKFKEELTDEKNKDLQSLFPGTHNTLMVIDDEIYNFQHYIIGLRENFENDIQNLPENFPKIIDNNKQFFDDKKALRLAVRQGAYLVRNFMDENHPGHILLNMESDSFSLISPNGPAAVNTLKLFSEGLKENEEETDNYWIGHDQIKALIKDKNQFRVFLFLLSRQAELSEEQQNLSFSGGSTLNERLLEVVNDFDQYYNVFSDFFLQLNRSTQTLNQLLLHEKSEPGIQLSPVVLTSYFGSTIDLLESILQVDKVIPSLSIFTETERQELESFIRISRTASRIINNTTHKKYGAAIVDLVDLYKFTIVDQLSPGSDTSSNRQQRDLLLKYGTFMASMIEAETSEDMSNVIETFAMPPGSYTVKRESKFNVSINSYVGLYGGFEKAKQGEDSWNSLTGVTAPLGVALSWGHTKKNKDSGRSFSIYGSLIDIGAITAFRFSNDSSDVAKVYLKEIVSPGLFFSYGFPNSPLSFNIGGQVAPRLRRLNENDNGVDLEYYSRFSASLVVDIPLLNLYTKPKP